MKRLLKVNTTWRPALAYAIGLIATDGNLSNDGRHITFTSKDKDLINIFRTCLELVNRIGKSSGGYKKILRYFRVQFGDKNFYEFLLSLGLTPTKSRTIGALALPPNYFADFFRGCIDGDGNINVFYHRESQHPQLKLRLFSASVPFLKWIKDCLQTQFLIKKGSINKSGGIFQLLYGKADAEKILKLIYYKGTPAKLAFVTRL